MAGIEAAKVMCDRIQIVQIRRLLTLTNRRITHHPHRPGRQRRGHVVCQIQRRVSRERHGCVDLIRKRTLEREPLEMNQQDLGQPRDG